VAGNALAQRVEADLQEHCWSPEQVSGRLLMEHPEERTQQVSHETIYQYIYAHPAGELKRILIPEFLD
jgi:IS30 family transposase